MPATRTDVDLESRPRWPASRSTSARSTPRPFLDPRAARRAADRRRVPPARPTTWCRARTACRSGSTARRARRGRTPVPALAARRRLRHRRLPDGRPGARPLGGAARLRRGQRRLPARARASVPRRPRRRVRRAALGGGERRTARRRAGRIGVGGGSAGAGLAAALALLARDRGGPPLAFQYLDAPALDDRMATPSSGWRTRRSGPPRRTASPGAPTWVRAAAMSRLRRAGARR